VRQLSDTRSDLSGADEGAGERGEYLKRLGEEKKRELKETPRRLWAARPFSFAVDQGGAGVGFMHQGSSNVGMEPWAHV
jgi:hypothetical protein